MNKIALFASATLIFSMFAPLAFAVGPIQPPIDTTTLYVGSGGWGPYDADPAYAYDSASEEILFNVYDTLIWAGNATLRTAETYWNFMPLLATSVPDQQMFTDSFSSAGMGATSPLGFVPSDHANWRVEGWVDSDGSNTTTVGDVLYIGEYPSAPTVPRDANGIRVWRISSLDTIAGIARWYYNFPLRIGGSYPTINFYDNTKTVVDTFSSDDVVYTFQRAVVQDLDGSPIWMFDKPLFDVQVTESIPSVAADTVDGAWMLAKLIANAYQDLGNNTFQINLGVSFPDTA